MQSLWKTMRDDVTLAALFLMISGVFISAAGDEEALRPSPEIIPGFIILENLCTQSRLHSENISGNLTVLVDGSRNSGLRVNSTGESKLEIEFSNRAPWLNTVRIVSNPQFKFTIDIRDAHRVVRQVDWLRNDRAIDKQVSELVFQTKDLRATSLIITVSGSSDAIDGQLFEVEAFFESMDPDGILGIDDGTSEIGVEYCQYYKGAPCPAGNIPKTKNDATNLAKRLNNHLGWTRSWAWSNSMAWERDFNLSDNTWVDAVDFAYFSGHGSIGTAWFTHKVLDCSMYRTEANGRYGGLDMEWIGFSSCQTLRRQGANLPDWFGSFSNLHLMCGWHSNMRDTDFGDPFGKRVGSWKWTIPQAWLDAAYATHGSFLGSIFGGSIYSPVILAEDKAQFNDHVWGAGAVTADPPHDNTFWVMWSEIRGFKSALPPDPNLSDATTIVSEAKDGPTFVVPLSVVTKSQPDSVLQQLLVLDRTVDSLYVVDILDEFCLNDSIFCTPSITYDGSSNEYNAVDGVHELHVSVATGGWVYANTEAFAVPTDSALLALPSESQAFGTASSFWGQHGVTVTDVADSFVTYLRQEKWTTGGVTAGAWDLSINAERLRLASGSGKRIVGPGASMAVTIGESSSIQRAAFGGWRNLFAGSSFTAIALSSALQSVSNSGPEITIGSMPLCDTFIVIDANLGYYEAGPDTSIEELTPVWIIDGTCIHQGDTSAYQLLVPADRVAPVGTILSPSSGTVVATNSAVSLSGSATSGTGPYQYSWSSDRDGFLGTGASLNVDSLTTDARSGSTTHTIILEVTDANGLKDFDAVNVIVNTPAIGASIRTASTRLRVNQLGRVGSQIAASQFYFFSDTLDYLFDGSLILGSSAVDLSWSLYDGAGCPPFVSTLPAFSYDSTGFATYRIASGSGQNSDGTLGFKVDYYAPKHPDSSNFFVARFMVYKGLTNPSGTKTGITLGFASDWDIPSDVAQQNTGGVDGSRQMIYQHGTGAPSNLNRFGAIAAYRGSSSAITGGFVWENDTHLPFVQSDLWNAMQALGSSQYTSTNASSNLSSVLVVGRNLTINGAAHDTIKFAVVIAASSSSGNLTVLKSTIDKGKNWICTHNLLPSASICAGCNCGDSDNNGIITISDAVYLINYIFAGGPAPALPCLGDADGNNIITISDAVYLINYIFDGGPTPSCP